MPSLSNLRSMVADLFKKEEIVLPPGTMFADIPIRTAQYRPATDKYLLSTSQGVSIEVASHELTDPRYSAVIQKAIKTAFEDETLRAIYEGSSFSHSTTNYSMPFHSGMNVVDNKSLVTMNDADMTEQTNMIDAAELLVEIDRKVAQHGGRFGTQLTCQESILPDALSERMAQMGAEQITKGEIMTPYGLIVTGRGMIRFVVSPVQEEGSTLVRPHYGLNLDQLDEAFPDVAASVRDLIQHSVDEQPTQFIHETARRLNNKPALIALVHDYLKNGRDVITGLQAEQVEQEQAGFYGAKDDYGTF